MNIPLLSTCYSTHYTYSFLSLLISNFNCIRGPLALLLQEIAEFDQSQSTKENAEARVWRSLTGTSATVKKCYAGVLFYPPERFRRLTCGSSDFVKQFLQSRCVSKYNFIRKRKFIPAASIFLLVYLQLFLQRNSA